MARSAIPIQAGTGTPLPSQTGNTGKFLTTDGTNPSWATVAGGGASPPTINTFVATAGQTTFALSGTPSSVQNLTVAGIKARRSAPADYTITGTTLTLTNPASVGEEVEIHFYV